MQLPFQQFPRGEFGQVLSDSDPAVVEPQELVMFLGFVGTQDETEGRGFTLPDVVLLKPAQVQQTPAFVAKRANAPAFNTAQLGVEIAFQAICEWNQLNEMAADQLSRQRRDNLQIRENLGELDHSPA